MKFVIAGIVGIAILLIASVCLLSFTYKLIRENKSKLKIGLNIFLIILLAVFICFFSLSITYNYFYIEGINLISQNKQQEAIKPLKKALSIRNKIGKLANLMEIKICGTPLFYSNEKDVRISLANSYKSLGNYQEAIKEFKEVILIDNYNFDAVAGLAESLVLSRNFREAKQEYQKLIEIQPKEKNFNYYLQMGKASMILLDYNSAIKYFEKALEFGKEEDLINRYLEICYKSVILKD